MQAFHLCLFVFCFFFFETLGPLRSIKLLIFFNDFYLFIYMWLCCMAFYLVVVSRGCSPVSVCRLLIAAASLVAECGLLGSGLQKLWPMGSVVAAPGLQSTGSIVCGAWVSLLCGMWDLPGSGIEPMTPALPAGFFTSEPPGKPHLFL